VKLVVIYGAPGVGKLTTAQVLAELTGFKLFHNHLSFNLVRAIFEFPTPAFGDLNGAIRLATFEAAARARLAGLIFTFVYAAPEDDAFVEQMCGAVERHGGEAVFARLTCNTGVQEARVAAAGRGELGKLTRVEDLRWALGRRNLTAPMPGRPALEIDNYTLGAEAVARRIAQYFALPVPARATTGGPGS